MKLPAPTEDQAKYLRDIQRHAERGYDPTAMVGGPQRPCMYEDESMADFERRYRPRRDGTPGREVECKMCGGVWAIGIGGKPSECRRNNGEVAG